MAVAFALYEQHTHAKYRIQFSTQPPPADKLAWWTNVDEHERWRWRTINGRKAVVTRIPPV